MSEDGTGRRRTPVADLLAVLALAALLAVFAFSPLVEALPGAGVVALPVLLVVPGYAVVAAVFPDPGDVHDDHPFLGALSLAIGASVAVVSAVALTLDFSVWGFAPLPLVSGVCLLTVLGVTVAWTRRRRIGVTAPPRRERLARVRRLLLGGRPLVIVLTLVVVVAGAAAVGVVATEQSESAAVTELYLLGETEDGSLAAGAYPTNLTVGREATYVVGVGAYGQSLDGTVVASLERVRVEGGSVVVEDGSAVVESARELARFPVDLRAGGSTQIRHTVAPGTTGEDLRLTYRLYRGNPADSQPLREVHVGVTVTAPGGEADET